MKTKTSFKKERGTSCLTKAQLLDYIFKHDKEDEPKIENHLEICGHCLRKFKLIQGLRRKIMCYLSLNSKREPVKNLIRRLINAIKKGLRKGALYYQHASLSKNTMYGYVDGTLEAFYPEKYRGIESHILTCDSCLKRVYRFWKDYRKFLHTKEEEIPPELLEKSLNNIESLLQIYTGIKPPKPPQTESETTQHKPIRLKRNQHNVISLEEFTTRGIQRGRIVL